MLVDGLPTLGTQARGASAIGFVTAIGLVRVFMSNERSPRLLQGI